MWQPADPDRRARWLGIAAFLLVMFGLTWATAAALDPLWPIADDPHPSRLLRASVLYASLMTLQPVVALVILRRWFGGASVDLGLRPAPRRWHVVSIVGPLVLVGTAAALAMLLEDGDRAAAAVQDVAGARATGGASRGFFLLFGFFGVLCMLWVQATTEELGWRGFLLPLLMRQLGPWVGLFAHGALWGLWYAPLLLVTTGTALPSLARCLTFVVTCSLLGVLLGWIRIATRSVIAAASANATLTICAALPLVLHGDSPPRTGIFLPIGWIPLAVAIAAIVCTRQRRAIGSFDDGA
jgi:membrane protease YdiL (CAAX protease family)